MARPRLRPLKVTPRVVSAGSLSKPSRPGKTAFAGPVLAAPAVVAPGRTADYRKGTSPTSGKKGR